jgi:uncharacterized protein (TIGR01244 family)
MNIRAITNHISIGGQPDEADLQELQDKGFRTIINLRAEGERDYRAEEEREVEGRGLNYSSIPVTPELLDDMAMQRFSNAIDAEDAPPVFVHCAGGGRAGVLTLIHLAVENGWSLLQADATGKELGLTPPADSPYRAFYEDYIRRHSAGQRA